MNLIIRVISFNCSSQQSRLGASGFCRPESEKVFAGVAWEVITSQCCGNPQINIFLLHLGTDTGMSGFC